MALDHSMAQRFLFVVITFSSFTSGFHTRSQNFDLTTREAHMAHLLKENVTEAKPLLETNDVQKVKIEVYYETLCPASVDFFTSQLRPVVERLASFVDVRLVPYGHAKTWSQNGRYRFRCQHGPAECYGNRLQACVLDVVRNATKATLLNACLLQYTTYRYETGSYDYYTAVNWCSYKLRTPVNGIWHCAESERGSILLKEHGDATHALRPRYVPYVVLDGSTKGQARATADLQTAVCQNLPASAAPAACQNGQRRR